MFNALFIYENRFEHLQMDNAREHDLKKNFALESVVHVSPDSVLSTTKNLLCTPIHYFHKKMTPLKYEAVQKSTLSKCRFEILSFGSLRDIRVERHRENQEKNGV